MVARGGGFAPRDSITGSRFRIPGRLCPLWNGLGNSLPFSRSGGVAIDGVFPEWNRLIPIAGEKGEDKWQEEDRSFHVFPFAVPVPAPPMNGSPEGRAAERISTMEGRATCNGAGSKLRRFPCRSGWFCVVACGTAGLERKVRRTMSGETNPIITMLHWTLVFLVVALIAAVLGFGGIAGAAAGVAKVLFFVFLVIWIVSLFMGRGRRV